VVVAATIHIFWVGGKLLSATIHISGKAERILFSFLVTCHKTLPVVAGWDSSLRPTLTVENDMDDTRRALGFLTFSQQPMD
jgi:hypothetical protein